MFQASIRAVLLDLDGTLYAQTPLRCLMAMELCTLPLQLQSWQMAKSTLKTLRCFRKTREELRELGFSTEHLLSQLQFQKAGDQAGVPEAFVEEVVREWMYHRPLKYLKGCRRRGVETFFDSAHQVGLQIGVFSDYPVQEKLKALGLDRWVKLAFCATDKEVNAFKPHPRGFLFACEHWGLRPEEVLYVGDRPEVDAEGALAAGMPCVILNGQSQVDDTTNLTNTHGNLTSFRGLQHALTIHC